MSSQSVTLNLPDPVYQHFKRRAEKTRRSVEEETLEVLAAAVPGNGIPDDLENTLGSLNLLDDAALWNAAGSRLAQDVSAELEELHTKRQREGLTEAETQRVEDLLRQYERHMVVRAQAAALLKDRGHDVSGLVRP